VLVLVSLVELSLGVFLVTITTTITTTHAVEGEGDRLMARMELTQDSSFQTLGEVEDVIVEEGKEDKLPMKMMLEQDFLV